MSARHGTHGRYTQGCRCVPCRQAHSEQRSLTFAAEQQRTSSAPRYGEPWTPAEDRELLSGAGTLTDRALRLGRTRSSVEQRLTRLRANGGNA